jgi:uncharacterized membrane protein HdeD (DUF308 family)
MTLIIEARDFFRDGSTRAATATRGRVHPESPRSIGRANTTTAGFALPAAEHCGVLADERQSGREAKGVPDMLKSVANQIKSSSTHLILLGVLAVIIGILALAWPGVTVLALVILFAIWAFTDSVLQFMRMASSAKAGPVVGRLLLALLDIAAGVVALAWPAPTALVLVLVVAIWAFVGGFFEIFAAFQSGESAGTRVLYVLGGLVAIAFGVVLFARPGVGAVTLALLFGLFALIYGIWAVVAGIQIRQTGRVPHSLLDQVA